MSARIAMVAAPLFALAAIAVAAGTPWSAGWPMVTAGLGSAAVIGATALPWASWRARAWVVVLVMFAVGVVAERIVGLLAGPAAVFAFAVVVGGLLLGARAMALVLVGAVVSTVVFRWGAATGQWTWPIDAAGGLDTDRGVARTAIVAFLGIGLIGWTVTAVVARVEAAHAREREQTRLREASERARMEGERRALAAQRLELLGRVAAGLAHDLANQLTMVRVITDELRGHPDPSVSESAREVEQALGFATALIRQMLALGRQDPTEARPVSLRALVDDVHGTLGRVLPTTVALRVEHDREAWVQADPAQLHRVLLNFTVNARDAEPSKVVVRTRCEVLAAPEEDMSGPVPAGAWSVLEVEDDGSGMDEATRRRVLEPFFTTKEGRGTGLGLASVAEIATAGGGHVRVWSRPGEGTRIGLWLPSRSVPAE